MKWEKNEIEYLVRNYPQRTPTEIAKFLNRSVGSINVKMKSMCIDTSINKKYVPKDFKLDNKEDLYIMGFLWADGYLHNIKNRLELSILTEDFNDISKLFDINNWAIYNRTRSNRKPQTTAGLYGEMVCNIFRDTYNYVEKSLSAPNFIDMIPKNLLLYFVRGFFDGDGCFYISKDNKQKQCYLCGTYYQDWSWIEEIFKNLNIEYIIKRKIQNVNSKYSIIYIKKNSMENFGKYIYKDYENDRIGLKRKYEKFILIR